MRTRLKLVATVVAASVAFGSAIAPASAVIIRGGTAGGSGIPAGAKFAGVCLFGSAFGLIFAALAKGQVYKNDKIELTRQEAFGIAGSCGLGAGPVISNWRP